MQNYFKSIRNFLVKWTCTTNHKQIGTLYMLLGGFSGIMGMVLSIFIRCEVAHEGGLIFDGNYTLMVYFFAPIVIGCFNWIAPIFVGASDAAFPRLNNLSFWLLLWSLYLLACSLFLYGAGTGTSHPLLGSIKSHASSIHLAILSTHLAGAASIVGFINTIATLIKASSAGTLLIRRLLFIKALLGALLAGAFFISPIQDSMRQAGRNNRPPVKFVIPPIIVFLVGYFGGKVLDAAPHVYQTYQSNAAIRNSQTPEQRAAYRAEIIARRAIEEPPSPTEGFRGEQKSSAFTDWVMSSPDFGTVVGLFVFSVFLVALFVSLHRLYIARQLRVKGALYSKKLASAGVTAADSISIGFLTAAISFPLGRVLQHSAWVQAGNPDASDDLFGYGPAIYDLLASDAFFSVFTIGCTALVALIVWYLDRI